MDDPMEQYKKALKPLDALNNSTMKAIASMNELANSSAFSLANSPAMKSIASMNELLNSSAFSLANSPAMKAIASMNELANSSALSLANSPVMKAIASMNELLNSSAFSLANSPAMKAIASMNELANSSAFSLANSPAMKAFEAMNGLANEVPTTEENIAIHMEELGRVKTPTDFLQVFAKLPPVVRLIIFFIFGHLLVDITVNISANILTPYVESLITSSEKPNKELIKDIASISIDNFDLEPYRFVTTENLILREQASTKSPILDNLQLGQVLTVLSRNRNWLEVTYSYSDGKVMRGWVFARYTEKFHR